MHRLKTLFVTVGIVILLGAGCSFSSDNSASGVLNELQGTAYYNEIYKFSIPLNELYAGYKVSVTHENEYAYDVTDAPTFRFNIDATNTTWPGDQFEVFQIMAFPLEWWNTYVTVEDNLAYDDYTDEYLGEYIVKNHLYAFVGHQVENECPQMKTDGTNEISVSKQCKAHSDGKTRMHELIAFLQ